MNDTFAEEGQGPPPGGPQCGPPPGWTGPPPPGSYVNAAELMWKIFPPIIILFGTFGNSLTVLILLRQSRKLSSTAVFLMTLAISDTLFLFNAPLRHWILAVWDIDIRHISDLGCKFSIYLTYSSYQFSSWILVTVTIERLISIVRPHYVKLGCTSRLATTAMFVLFIIIFGLNTHIFYGFGRTELPVEFGGLCGTLHEGYQRFWDKIYSWIDLAVVFAVPFIILLLANAIIITKLRQTRRTRRRLSIVRTQNEKNHAKDTKVVTVMLILLSVVFFLCLTPVSIFFVYRPYWLESIEPSMCSDLDGFIKSNEIIVFVHALTNIIGYINASFNFVLYVVSGSKFRAELRALFLCQRGHGIGIFGGGKSSTRRQLTYTTQTSSRHGSQKSISSVSTDPKATSFEHGAKEESIGRQNSNPTCMTEAISEKDKDVEGIIVKTKL